jgi:hypothetical protein
MKSRQTRTVKKEEEEEKEEEDEKTRMGIRLLI